LNTTTVRGAGPLYAQVRELLTARISAGEWQPGQLIPSEVRLAGELRVSQGTVRKAIDELVAANVLVRQQGKGTFVATHDTHRALFHFFHIVGDDGHKALPLSEVVSCRRRRATSRESAALRLATGARIIEIERVRRLNERPTIRETIIVPVGLFPDLGRSGRCELPNTLYEVYEERYGITIHRAQERLRAVAADPRDAELLGIHEGAPLLEIERLALTLSGAPVELRLSRCDTREHHYYSSLT
jgi:GntR family transcriptional regulator